MESFVLMLRACGRVSYALVLWVQTLQAHHPNRNCTALSARSKRAAAATYLNVLVLARQGLDHLLDCARQVFRVLFCGEFGVAESQHAAAAGGNIEQGALFCALNLQLQVFLCDLMHRIR